MPNNEINIQQRTENFSIRVIKAYCLLLQKKF
jgi:hypothetical protein